MRCTKVVLFFLQIPLGVFLYVNRLQFVLDAAPFTLRRSNENQRSCDQRLIPGATFCGSTPCFGGFDSEPPSSCNVYCSALQLNTRTQLLFRLSLFRKSTEEAKVTCWETLSVNSASFWPQPNTKQRLDGVLPSLPHWLDSALSASPPANIQCIVWVCAHAFSFLSFFLFSCGQPASLCVCVGVRRRRRRPCVRTEEEVAVFV